MIRYIIKWMATGRRFFLIQNDDESPYLLRIRLRGRLPGEPETGHRSDYLHRIYSEDRDRFIHNHPWEWAYSIILSGGYIEERRRPDGTTYTRRLWPFWMNPFRCVSMLGPREFHRIRELKGKETWTYFRCGRKRWAWGFLDKFNRWTEESEFARRKGKKAPPTTYPDPPWLKRCKFCECQYVGPGVTVPARLFVYAGQMYQPPAIELCQACAQDPKLTMESVWDKDDADRVMGILRRETRVRDTDG